MSAARQAAEAAFAAPRVSPAPPLAAVVTVRRARPASGPREPVDAPPGDLNDVASDTRSPRVFRVEASPRSPIDPAEAGPPASPGPLALAAPSGDAGAAPVKRRRRVDIDKRPGPVLHLVHAVPAVRAVAPSAAPTLDSLRAQLARVGEVLQAIERAQSFQFVDPRYAVQWQRLSQTADAIREDIPHQML